MAAFLVHQFLLVFFSRFCNSISNRLSSFFKFFVILHLRFLTVFFSLQCLVVSLYSSFKAVSSEWLCQIAWAAWNAKELIFNRSACDTFKLPVYLSCAFFWRWTACLFACFLPQHWITEKHQQLRQVEGGKDLAAVQSAQRRLVGTERDVAAITDKVHTSSKAVSVTFKKKEKWT